MKKMLVLLVWGLVLTACAPTAPTVVTPTIPPATETPAPTDTPLPSATFTPTATITPTSTLGPTPVGGSNRLVFGLQRRLGEGYENLGVYLFDLNTLVTAQIAPAGWNFQSASPDGRWLLLNHGPELYRTAWDGSDLHLLTDSFFFFGRSGALWLSDGSGIAFLISTPEGAAITLTDQNGSSPRSLGGIGETPVELYPSFDHDRVFWERGTCSGEGVCQRQGGWSAPVSGGASTSLVGLSRPIDSPLGNLIAGFQLNSENQFDLALLSATDDAALPVELPGDVLSDFAWSPDGSRLAAIRYGQSTYSGRVGAVRTILYTPATQGVQEFAETDGLLGRVLWSPDGRWLLLSASVPLESGGYHIGLRLIELSTGRLTALDDQITLTDDAFIFLTNLAWLLLP